MSSFVREVLLVVHPDDRSHFGSKDALEKVRGLVMEQRRVAHARAMAAWRAGGGEGEFGGTAPVLDTFVPSVSVDPYATLGLRRAADLSEVEVLEEAEDSEAGARDGKPGLGGGGSLKPGDGELPDYGVVATSADRLVECDNRLLSRLQSALQGAQPVVRAALFPAADFSIGPAIEKAIERTKAGEEGGASRGAAASGSARAPGAGAESEADGEMDLLGDATGGGEAAGGGGRFSG